ncbi:unnamed protein product [Cylicostephanus goldi]|uniref:MULE transposase domain-containing protein n=1 Tax=Cylicostephanus goldi TaxID=71465 RepID=A0A3P7MBQ1_CYLGO|nr:unnamed protein product [Cylicostephanus goldi]
MTSDNLMASADVMNSNILMTSNLMTSDDLLTSDDLFNTQMINMVQQFYLMTDSTAQFSQETQLYTSFGTVSSEQYYLESQEIREYITLETRQENESLITVVHTTANVREGISGLPQVEDISELPVVAEISEPPVAEEISEPLVAEEISEIPLVYRGEKQVHNDTFDRDPCTLAHNCLPLDRYSDKANRIGYQKRIVALNNVPDDLRNVPGGGAFMQLETEDLHVYYCKETVEMARDHGLYALVGDGVHNLNPVTIPNRMDKGQLYVLHAAVQGGIEVPILYAVARYKNVETYKTIFGSLREILGEFSDRFILDFEKAAIRAAKETFPEADVQGCAFHLAQSWNRMAVNLGVQKFVKGPKAVLAVKNWWKILKGMAYLPEELLNRVTALLAPPVSEAHAAYVPCNDFLKYLNSIYFNGTFKGMWCKWDMRDFRTTNTAEAFHSKLRGMLSRRINPPFEELLECLHAINTVALGSLYHIKEVHTL